MRSPFFQLSGSAFSRPVLPVSASITRDGYVFTEGQIFQGSFESRFFAFCFKKLVGEKDPWCHSHRQAWVLSFKGYLRLSLPSFSTRSS
ncbi:hypothetical protein TIFTF001_053310, partial [Ficus carica]